MGSVGRGGQQRAGCAHLHFLWLTFGPRQVFSHIPNPPLPPPSPAPHVLTAALLLLLFFIFFTHHLPADYKLLLIAHRYCSVLFLFPFFFFFPLLCCWNNKKKKYIQISAEVTPFSISGESRLFHFWKNARERGSERAFEKGGWKKVLVRANREAKWSFLSCTCMRESPAVNKWWDLWFQGSDCQVKPVLLPLRRVALSKPMGADSSSGFFFFNKGSEFKAATCSSAKINKPKLFL